MEIFKEKGYGSQRDVVRALCKQYLKGSEEKSVAVFLSSILLGKRHCPEKMEKALYELSGNNNEILEILSSYRKPLDSLEGRILYEANAIWDQLREYQARQDQDQIWEFYTRFRNFAKEYIEIGK